MRLSRPAVALLAAGVLSSTCAAAPAHARTDVLTPAQEAMVVSTLVNAGLSPTDAQDIADDPVEGPAVPVSGVGLEQEVTTGGPSGSEPAPSDSIIKSALKLASTGGTMSPASIGTCSGYGSWVDRTQYINNAKGDHIAYIKLHTNFSWNMSRVTCAASVRSHYIYSWASLLVVWNGWDDYQEYFYTTGGHANGGILTQATGTFGMCVALKGCILNRYPWAQTRGYQNGTSLTYGGTP